jgi:NADH:ubiquinone oxidoreductase subunit E
MQKIINKTVLDFNCADYHDNDKLLRAFRKAALQQGWRVNDADEVIMQALSGNKRYVKSVISLYTQEKVLNG